MAALVGNAQVGPALRVGSYLLGRRLGQGGMGSVFEATHESIGQRAAVKLLHPHLTQDQPVVNRFLNEARAISMVQHPGLVKIFDFGSLPDGMFYILMELLDGESLLERLKRRGALPLPEALRVARQIASALDAAHQKGIVHRDLKPSNVVIVKDPEAIGGERAKLLDFGVAKLQAGGSSDGDYRTEIGAILGTPAYMAPEQARAEAVDGRADVYSLGVMLHQMVVGRLPFRGDSPTVQLAQHQTVLPPPLVTEAPGTPPALSELVLAMMAKDPRQRPLPAQVAQMLLGLDGSERSTGAAVRAAAATVTVATINATSNALGNAMGNTPGPMPSPLATAPQPVTPDPRALSEPGRGSLVPLPSHEATAAPATPAQVMVSGGGRAPMPPPAHDVASSWNETVVTPFPEARGVEADTGRTKITPVSTSWPQDLSPRATVVVSSGGYPARPTSGSGPGVPRSEAARTVITAHGMSLDQILAAEAGQRTVVGPTPTDPALSRSGIMPREPAPPSQMVALQQSQHMALQQSQAMPLSASLQQSQAMPLGSASQALPILRAAPTASLQGQGGSTMDLPLPPRPQTPQEQLRQTLQALLLRLQERRLLPFVIAGLVLLFLLSILLTAHLLREEEGLPPRLSRSAGL